MLTSIFRLTNVRSGTFLGFHHLSEGNFKGGILMKIAVFSSKNTIFSCFAAVYEVRNVPNVFKNILNMFSNLKLISSDEGLHWNTLVLMVAVTVYGGEKIWPFVSV